MASILLVGVVLSLGAADRLVAGPVEEVGGDYMFTEGPLWIPGEGLVFSDIPADTIYRGDGSVFRKPSGNSNGLALDCEGRLIACEHGNRRVTRTEKDGSINVLADEYMGRRLNSPNDLVVRSDGMIFFTDPPYGIKAREAELPFCGVYAIVPPDNELKLLSVYFRRPNGVALSPDEKTLYVADSGDGFIQAFDVAEDGMLSNSRLFARARPDGMKVDVKGRLWTSDGKGVSVFSPEGEKLEFIEFSHAPSNCAFGGDDNKTLFVTARPSVFKVRVETAGLRPCASGEEAP